MLPLIMQKDSRFYEDLARMMSGASNLAFDAKREMEAMVAQQVETFLNKTSLVTREEFEAVQEMARKAREENEALREEIEALKAASAAKESAASGSKTTRTASNSKSSSPAKSAPNSDETGEDKSGADS